MQGLGQVVGGQLLEAVAEARGREDGGHRGEQHHQVRGGHQVQPSLPCRYV